MKTLKSNQLTMVMLLVVLAFAAKIQAFSHEDARKSTPTHNVKVVDVLKANDMPRELRTNEGNAVINSLSVNDFNINPANPGYYNLAFNLTKSGPVYVRIVDNDGYDVYFETFRDGMNYNKQIDLSLLSGGTYYFQVVQKGKAFTRKLIFS